MDWIVFGDDLYGHPSTMKHIMANMPKVDRVFWFDSLGMRSPSLKPADLKRMLLKAGRIISRHNKGHGHSKHDSYVNVAGHISPAVLPFHLNPLARFYNNVYLKAKIRGIINKYGLKKIAILSHTPVISLYDLSFPQTQVKLIYYKLDEYSILPGVDSKLISLTEKYMFEKADNILATAAGMLPPQWKNKCHYISQGVDFDHFSKPEITIPSGKTLGFFGLIAEWMDFDLIKAVAVRCPDWDLEFIGPRRFNPPGLEEIPNIKFLPPIPYNDLPSKVSHWKAAWIPFKVDDLTAHVNPLKAREYLALGLPALSTPMPEVRILSDTLEITDDPDRVASWLINVDQEDNITSRTDRRNKMSKESWEGRAKEIAVIAEKA